MHLSTAAAVPCECTYQKSILVTALVGTVETGESRNHSIRALESKHHVPQQEVRTTSKSVGAKEAAAF